MANATNEAQLDGSQKTQVVDSSGNPVNPTAAAAADGESNATTMTAVRARLMAFNGTTWDPVRSGITALVATFLGFVNSLPYAKYNLVPATRSDTNGGPLEADAIGNLRISEQAPPAYENVADASAQVHEKPATSAAFNAIAYDTITIANAGVVKSSPGNLYRLWITNDDTGTLCYALVNKATTPANGDAPIMYFFVPTKETRLIEFKFGKRFTTGIGWAQTTGIAATITLGTAHTVANAEVG